MQALLALRRSIEDLRLPPLLVVIGRSYAVVSITFDTRHTKWKLLSS